jgi:hypothetical protein
VDPSKLQPIDSSYKQTLQVVIPLRLFRMRTICCLLGLSLLSSAPPLSARLIPVKHREGVSHGFLVLRSKDGQTLATGDMIQTVEGERITTELVLRFKDGSIHDEVTVSTQRKQFRLLTDHLRQHGPSFPHPLDVYIDAASGNVKVRSEKDGRDKSEDHHLQIPEDAANGLVLILLKNISPSEPEIQVSMVATTAKPRVVKLKIHSEGEQPFFAGGSERKAIHHVIHVDIGGVAGVVAPIIGKEPPDTHIWMVGGNAPTFVKFEGPLYEEGPIWTIDLADVKWER